MITIRKLASLPPGTRIRKLVQLLDQWDQPTGRLPVPVPEMVRYLSTLSSYDLTSPERFQYFEEAVQELESIPTGPEETGVHAKLHRRILHRLRFFLLEELGSEPAEWDLRYPEEADHSTRNMLQETNPGKKFPIRLYLDEIRSPFNVGSIFRTAACFGVEKILLAPGTASPHHPRAKRSAMGTIEQVPWEMAPYEILEVEPNLFALETGGTPIEAFPFPAEGICILGSEELGVHPRLLSMAKKKRGIVSIPLHGTKSSLNVSVASGILMHQWVQQLVPH
ncbi:MAG: hypothetical protein Kow009_07300 [Spirochaetales bacterium]